MPSPDHRFARLQFTIAILLHGSLVFQPIDSVAAEPKTSVAQLQKVSKLFVEPFSTAIAANLPENHLDVAALLTEAIRKQLDDEHRLQTDSRLRALKLVGVVLSYSDLLLNVQAELYDGNQYLAYSRVERQLEPADDWLEDIDLIAEQLLDELIDELRKSQQQGNSQHFNISPNNCFNRHSYASDPACNNSYYSGWGWWRQYDGYHARDRKGRHDHDQIRVHEEHHRQPHNEQHKNHQEKHHWISDASIEHHHKPRRIEDVIPAPLNTNPSVEMAKPIESETGLPQEQHHHVREARQNPESPASMLKPDSIERIDSTALPNSKPRHVHQSAQSSNATSQKVQDASSASLPDESGANLGEATPKTESTIVNKDSASPAVIPVLQNNQETDSTSAQSTTEQAGHERHHEFNRADTRSEKSASTSGAQKYESSQSPEPESTQAVATPALQTISTSPASAISENVTPSVDTSSANSSPASSSSFISSDSTTTMESSSSTSSSVTTPSYSSETSSGPSSTSSSTYSSDSGSSSGSSSSSTASYSSTPSYISPAPSSSSDNSSSSTSSPTPTPSTVEPPAKPEPVKQVEPASSSTTP